VHQNVWQAWRDKDDGTVFAPRERCIELVIQGLLSESAILLHEIVAATGEEAMSLHYEKMGFGAYKPIGTPSPCPNNCGATYYPDGFGDCPNCGHIG
jgi:hypothetical protein